MEHNGHIVCRPTASHGCHSGGINKGCSPHGLDRHWFEDVNPVDCRHTKATVEMQRDRLENTKLTNK